MTRTLLLVDDEPAIRESLRRLLERAGWRVTTAGSAAEAIETASERPPDAMIMDFRMPDTSGQFASGLDLLRALRSQPHLASVPVVMLTGYFLTNEESLMAEQYGAMILYKPADLHTIAGHLARMCDKQGGATGVA